MQTREQLLSRSGVIVLYRGISVAGRVLNREGRPITGASVRLGRVPFDPARKTGPDGGFEFKNAPAGQNLLTIQATGYAPEVKSLRISNRLTTLEFRLGPGRTIRGQVFDSKGKPLAGASIATSLWDPRQSLDGRYRTDAAGRFVWENAPSDSVELTAWKEGHAAAFLKLEPSDDQPIFKLVPASRLRIKGTVTDAAINKSIETFTVVPMVNGGDTLMLDYAKAHHGGQYVFAKPRTPNPTASESRPRGTCPRCRPNTSTTAGNKSLMPGSRRAIGSRASSAGADGSPLAGVQVIYAEGRGISVHGGKGYQLNHHAHMTTEINGRFSFSPAEGDYSNHRASRSGLRRDVRWPIRRSARPDDRALGTHRGDASSGRQADGP